MEQVAKTVQETDGQTPIIGPPVNKILSRFALVFEPDRQPTFDCAECSDTGRISVKVPYRGKMVDETRPCKCKVERIRQAKLALMPPEFQGISIDTLTPRPEIHPDQVRHVETLKKYPGGKYIIAGDFGTGKTHFFWTLYTEAVKRGRKVWAGTARALIAEFQKAIEASQNGDRYILPITAAELRQDHTPYSIFLDDIDKCRATEYAAEQMFEIVDACYAFDHQLVITTNLRIADLEIHFADADRKKQENGFGRYGGAIMRRLLDKAREIEMF